MVLRIYILVLIKISFSIIGLSQSNSALFIDISNNKTSILTCHINQGTNHNSNGDTLLVNSNWFIKNSKPWYPVMGEFHYERFPKEQWEESILKMKAAGINILASYVFWIYHEEEKGSWDWNNRNDLKHFASLCTKHNMYLWLRIGPWCHGEVRNGGFPDWLLKEKIKVRTNDSLYLAYTKTLYKQIHDQAKDYYYKHNGTIIGIQLENEYGFANTEGLTHITTLKQIAVQMGMDVPYYSATGWPKPDLNQTEMIPMWGGYPEAPWNSSTTELPLSEKYKFDSLYRIDKTIGSDLLKYKKNDTTVFNGYKYPYSTAELGGGIQVTHHRRPIIEPKDVTAIAYYKCGSGANLLGYYMFHGGTNRIGKFSTLQESKSSGYPNDYPLINYDFQAPIGQWGERQSSYNSFKILHSFLNDFGLDLAITNPFFPEKLITNPSDTQTLRWAVRSDGYKGFVFINNYQRLLHLPKFNDTKFTLKLANNAIISFPEKAISIPQDAQIILPFNLNIKNIILQYATAQPLCILNNKQVDYIFFQQDGMHAEYTFLAKNIQSIVSNKNALIKKHADKYTITIIKAGIECIIKINTTSGQSINIFTISQTQALQAYKFEIAGKQRLFISNAGLILDKNNIVADMQGSSDIKLWMYPNDKNILTNHHKYISKNDGEFKYCTIALPNNKFSYSLQPIKVEKVVKDYNKKFKPFYTQTLQYFDSTNYWRFNIKNLDFNKVKDIMVEVTYQSDTYAAYLNNQLIADEFYYGLPFQLSLRQFKNKIQSEGFIFQLTALSKSEKVYFSESVRKTFQREKCTINSIKIIPEYAVEILIE